jgi:hypothetical protein
MCSSLYSFSPTLHASSELLETLPEQAMKSSSEWLCDEVLTRQCPCLGISIHGESVGTSGFDGFRQKQEYAGIYPGSPPRRVKTYILLVRSCIACIVGAVTMVAQMKSGYGRKRGVC